MKKIKGILVSLFAIVLTVFLAACGNGESTAGSEAAESTETTESTASSAETAEPIVLKVASQTQPMTDVVELAAEVIEAPYEIELMTVSDNIQYNEAVLNDEAFASFAQHEPFMEMFNEERDGDLAAVQPIYNALVGFYSPVYESVADIKDGAEVAIPSDITNEGRALNLLQAEGLIKLDDNAGLFPTVKNITENPKNLQFISIDLLNLTAAYEDGVELVFNYPTYIATIDLTTEDAIILENDPTNTYAISLVMREGNVDSEAAEALVAAFTSQEVYDFLDELAAQKHLVPAFEVK